MKIRAFFFMALIAFNLSAIRKANLHTQSDLYSIQTTDKKVSTDIIALIDRMKKQLDINNDQMPELIKEIENSANNDSNAIRKAILHSMAAEMYQNYFQRYQWDINQRSTLSGFIPEDIREWSANLFTEKIQKEINLSLEPASLLQNTSIDSYKEILKAGKDSPALRPTLFEFLAFRAIDIAPSTEIYKKIIAFQNKRKNTKAALLTELDYYHFLYGNKSDKESQTNYANALDELYRDLHSQEYAAEILIAKQQLISGYWPHYNSNHWDSIKAKEIQICKECIKRYPHYPRTAILKNRLAELERPTLVSIVKQTVYPGKDIEIQLSYTHISKVIVKIYRSENTPILLYKEPRNSQYEEKRNRLISEHSFDLNSPNNFIKQDTILRIPIKQLGLYDCVVTDPVNNIKTINTISVSRLAAINRQITPNQTEVMVTDFLSGKPIEHATVSFFKNEQNQLKKLGEVKTDKYGLALLPKNRHICAYQANMKEDQAKRITHIYQNDGYESTDKEPIELSLFTDRGVYRPGQTIYFKGIAYVKERKEPHVINQQSFTVHFYDAKGKEITNKQVVTNEFGSFNGEFTIPKQTLNGSFRIKAGEENLYIKVEEYKRPTFQTAITPIKTDVRIGDSITIEGMAKTFAETPLAHGHVKWQISCQEFLYKRYYTPSASLIIAEGETELMKNGHFNISFQTNKLNNNTFNSTYQTYEVTATITDSKGESQEAHYQFAIGESSLILYTELASQTERNTTKAIIKAQTINGTEVSVSGSFKIIKLKSNTTTEKQTSSDNIEEECLINGFFESGKIIDPQLFKQLPTGKYRLLFEAKDSQGRACKNQTDFILYEKEAKCPPVFTHTWLQKEKLSCLPGEEAEFVFGTSDKDCYILYEWFVRNKRIHQELIKLNNANQKFIIPFLESYGDGLVATFTFVKAGEIFSSKINITRKQPNKNLNIKPISFRDHLQPGNKEEWTFRITDADSTVVSAEVLTALYDASLDKILPFDWYFNPQRFIYLQAPLFSISNRIGDDSDYAKIDRKEEPQYQYDQLNWQDLFAASSLRLRGLSSRSHILGSGNLVQDVQLETEIELQEKSVAALNNSNKVNNSFKDSKQQNIPSMPLRKNFAETAFFYPNLRTNANGDILIHFTLPESNTTWKLQMIANTKDLKYGQLTKQIISNKPIMILPNLPRFMRQKDKVEIRAQIINNSNESLSGRAGIELFDPITNQPIVCLSKSQRPFELLPDSTQNVSWEIIAPDNKELIGIRLWTNSDKGCDGEQHLLPVLSNQLLITESKPFYLTKEHDTQIVLKQTEGKASKLTLEMSSNPIWYAVQALPTITQPKDENIISWFAAYFGNTLATHIAQANPQIRRVIDSWTTQKGNDSTLFSNLEKNQELKNILLEETPWALHANTESEQKQRLSLLFDLNRTNEQRNNALQQLLQQQNPDGGWGWLKGFQSNRSITLSILQGMSKLTQLNSIQYDEAEIRMQMNALKFLDQQIKTDYDNLLKYNKNWQNARPSAEQIRYLFIRSFYRDVPELGEAREAIRFYTQQTEKHWQDYGLMTKGEIAMLMHNNGKKDIAINILNWLKETATSSKENGMYWANNREENDFLNTPVDTHCLLIALFNEIAPDNILIDQMKQWLLNQKHTQNWESVPATVNAIYTLLLTGNNWLNEQNDCTATWNGKQYSTTNGDIATGYLKVSLPKQNIASMTDKSISIHKSGNAPAWGAIYEQYFQDIDKIKEQQGALSVDKKLFLEIYKNNERMIRPLTMGQALHVGNKVIVRLTIRTDRSMDYVFLKDLWAGCFEAAKQTSETIYREGICYYISPKDIAEHIFIEHLPQGTFVIEYPLYVNRNGIYSEGVCTIQCLYAPEFTSHTQGKNIHVMP